MKWNDIKNHLKNPSQATVAPASVATTPVSTVGSTPSPSVHNEQMRKWLVIGLILAVIIVGAIIVYLVFFKNSREMSPLSPEDTKYVQSFFDTNPPAKLEKKDLDYIHNFFTAPETTVPTAATPAAPATKK